MTQSRPRCRLCKNYAVCDVQTLKRHIKNRHNLEPSAYLAQFDSFWLKAETKTHKCRVCQKKITLNGALVRRHMTKAHNGLDVSKYFQQHVMNQTYKMDKLREYLQSQSFNSRAGISFKKYV